MWVASHSPMLNVWPVDEPASHGNSSDWEMHMQARTIDVRIVLTTLAIVFAFAVAIPLTTRAADEPDEFPMCWTGSYVTYLECVQANLGFGSERGTAAVEQTAIVRDTITDFRYMEMNTWGEDFTIAPLAAPYFPTPDDASLRHSGTISY